MDTSTEQNTLNIRQEEKADGAIGQKKGRWAQQQNRSIVQVISERVIRSRKDERFPMSNKQGHWERTDIAKQ